MLQIQLYYYLNLNSNLNILFIAGTFYYANGTGTRLLNIGAFGLTELGHFDWGARLCADSL